MRFSDTDGSVYNMRIEIPEFALVAMIGATSSGKTTFAHKHFKDTEVLSSDFFRAMVCDDENDQTVSSDAFELLYFAANKRLDRMKTTVIDATNAIIISTFLAVDI